MPWNQTSQISAHSSVCLGENITSDIPDWLRRRRCSSATGFGSGVDKYRPADIRGTPWAPSSCRCRSCRSTRAGNTPPAVAAADSVSGGTVWTPSHAASACDSGPCPNTDAVWWPTRCRRCWRTWELKVVLISVEKVNGNVSRAD